MRRFLKASAILSVLAAVATITCERRALGGSPTAQAESDSDKAQTPDAGQATADGESWKTVVEPRNFVFPDDHAAHKDHRIEWWYYTGNLQTAKGRRFGFELTFFRTGVNRTPTNPSRWTVRDLFITHFAISDVRDRRFHFFERTRRAGVGWAGASTERLHVWNEDWEVRLRGDDHVLKAAEQDCAIELVLTPQKPPVLHGDRGLSQKGPTRGNASYYYSLTRMKTIGSVTVHGQRLPVTGWSWMDHEFSSSFLEKGQQGWDWMSIQLDDGQELMIYQIRRADNTTDAFSSGTIIDREGRPESITHDQFQFTPAAYWRSPRTGARYPVRWRVVLPERQIDLNVTAAFPHQEMNTMKSIGTPYWEGSVTVSGSWQGARARGLGYLEMTGYQGRGLGGVYD
jgi:predicted secreted hydrolase